MLDNDRNITILFPNSNFSDLSNPLEADNTYRFPSTLQDWFSKDSLNKSDLIILLATSQIWKEMEKNLKLLDTSEGNTKKNANQNIKELILKAEKDSILKDFKPYFNYQEGVFSDQVKMKHLLKTKLLIFYIKTKKIRI